jgi:hypothetical protein
MMWQVEWRALSASIVSLVETGHFLVASAQVRSDDPYQARKVLVAQGQEIFGLIADFRHKYSSQLPRLAQQRLEAFCDRNVSTFNSGDGNADMQLYRLQLYIALLSSFRAELTYLFSDEKEVLARSLVDRAFLHLQRCIVADSEFARRWREAFENGETACEKLGACHLLQFGIYAFKAGSSGEQTDLVLGTKLQITPEVERAAEALVLTEWKLAKDPNARDAKIEEAYTQAKSYAVGSLAGFELELHRYLVIVSSDALEMPNDREDGSVVYHHKNIAVSPGVPSQRAREKPRRATLR